MFLKRDYRVSIKFEKNDSYWNCKPNRNHVVNNTDVYDSRVVPHLQSSQQYCYDDRAVSRITVRENKTKQVQSLSVQ